MEFMQVIKKRKSIRKYKDTQINDEELKQILFAGYAAPISRKDYASIKIIVVQDKTILQQISSSANSPSDPLYGAPTLIIISSTKASVKNVEYFNVACIVENMLLAATNINIGSIYLTYFLKKLIKQKSLLLKLGIPEGFIPISSVGLGYIAEAEEPNEDKDIEHRMNLEII